MTHSSFRPIEACIIMKECNLQKSQSFDIIGTTGETYGF
uniref:Uncharacterized protein n=1 Tax=Angiostrongylus cantonensis TaxID=6313 RepID=A0A0K0DED8_ANGCA